MNVRIEQRWNQEFTRRVDDLRIARYGYGWEATYGCNPMITDQYGHVRLRWRAGRIDQCCMRDCEGRARGFGAAEKPDGREEISEIIHASHEASERNSQRCIGRLLVHYLSRICDTGKNIRHWSRLYFFNTARSSS